MQLLSRLAYNNYNKTYHKQHARSNLQAATINLQ